MDKFRRKTTITELKDFNGRDSFSKEENQFILALDNDKNYDLETFDTGSFSKLWGNGPWVPPQPVHDHQA